MAEDWADTRPPRSLNELLKLTLNLSDQEMQNYETNFTAMDPERRQFLEEALNFVSQNDTGKILKAAVQFMQKFTESIDERKISDDDLEAISNEFDKVMEFVDNIDFANEFAKMGGLDCCIQMLKSLYSSLQWKAADCLAECCQNNPLSQSIAVQLKAIPTIIYVLENTDIDIVSVKCMHALSQIIGAFPPGMAMFMQLDGLRNILLAIASKKPKLKRKALTLILKLIYVDAEEQPQHLTDEKLLAYNDPSFIVSELIKRKVHTALIAVLADKSSDLHTISIEILLLMMNRNKEVIFEVKKHPSLKRLFTDRINVLTEEDAEANQETITMYDTVVNMCFPSS